MTRNLFLTWTLSLLCSQAMAQTSSQNYIVEKMQLERRNDGLDWYDNSSGYIVNCIKTANHDAFYDKCYLYSKSNITKKLVKQELKYPVLLPYIEKLVEEAKLSIRESTYFL